MKSLCKNASCKALCFTIMFLCIVLYSGIGLISAWGNTTFNNSLTAENLTFTGNENITSFLIIPDGTIVINAFLNLSGFLSTNIFTDDFDRAQNTSLGFRWNTSLVDLGSTLVSINISDDNTMEFNDQTTFTRAWAKVNQSGSVSNISFDLNSTTDGEPFEQNFEVYLTNTTEDDFITLATVAIHLSIRTDENDLVYWNSTDTATTIKPLSIFEPLQINITAINYTDFSYNITVTNNSGFQANVTDKFRRNISEIINVQFFSGTDSIQLYTLDNLTIESVALPSSPFLEINGSNIWNFTGEFNQNNNRTDNIATAINNFLTVCTLIGSDCHVPFLFHSDTAGDLQYSDMFFSSEGFVENNQTFNVTTYETTSEDFIINVTYSSIDWSAISAKLNYNGTNYTGSSTLSGDNVIFTRTLDIPLLTGTDAETYDFFWTISLTNITGIFDFNSETNNQTVNPLNVTLCTTNPFINFTTYNAENLSRIPAIFESSWEIRLADNGSVFRNDTYEDLTESTDSWAFCINPPDRNYTVSVEIEYDATEFAKNFYYINNLSLLNHTTSNISLYLLNDSSATLTVLEVINKQTRAALPETFISIQRYDIGTDTFYTVGMAKTNFNGEDLAYLNWYDTLYRFILVRGGTTILSTSPYKVAETPQLFEVGGETIFDFEKFEDFEYNLYYNDSTQNFVLTFVKPSGDVDSACLKVIKRNQTGDLNICTTCETSSTATIYCNIAAYGNGTFIATFYATGSLIYIDTIVKLIGITGEVYEMIGNEDGTVMAIIFAGIVMSLFLVSPVLAILGMLLGMIGAIALGFQPVDYYAFLGIVVVGGIAIWFLKR